MKNLKPAIFIASTAVVIIIAILFLTRGEKQTALPNTNQQANQSSTAAPISVLDDLGEPHLGQTTTSAIQKNILMWENYKPSDEFSLVSDCGQSENSRLFETMNKNRKVQTLHNSFTLILTPNPKKWNLTQAQQFTQDPTVTCGVGAPISIYADASHILWASRCLGGVMPDKMSPNYQKDVSCVQTSEVVSQYFGINSFE